MPLLRARAQTENTLSIRVNTLKHIIGTEAKDYSEWCRVTPPQPNNPLISKGQAAQHAECVFHCEHPQPFVYMGMVFCGRCYVKDNVFSLCVPCDEDIC